MTTGPGENRDPWSLLANGFKTGKKIKVPKVIHTLRTLKSQNRGGQASSFLKSLSASSR